MKAICVDNSNHHPQAYPLPEFTPLDVFQCGVHEDCYCVVGFRFGKDGVLVFYKKRRFIPLSDIDETELIKQRESVLV